MKLNAKVAARLGRLNVPELINESRLISASVAANPGAFPSPTPDLTVVDGAIDDLESAWNDAAGGDRVKMTIMRDKKAALLNLMNALAHYVEFAANGDEDIIHLAGFDTRKAPVRITSDFGVSHTGESGSVLVKVKAVAHATYIFQYSTEPVTDTTWTEWYMGTHSKTVISGLKPGATYWFRVAVVDKNGKHPFNTPLSIIAV